MGEEHARIMRPGQGRSGRLGGMGVRFMVGGDESGGGFALVEHPLKPHALGAQLHRHSREDEYSYVLEGRIAAKLGDEVIFGEPGDLIFKPRDQWHTFWNAGDTEARLLEVISPAGFERYFGELVELFLGWTPRAGGPCRGQVALRPRDRSGQHSAPGRGAWAHLRISAFP